MFRRLYPSQGDVKLFLARQKNKLFSYPSCGATHPDNVGDLKIPKHYVVDHHAICLGQGEDIFRRAVKGLKAWHCYKTSWTWLLANQRSPKQDSDLCIVVKHFGFYSLNALRIVYVLERSGHFSFAVGTLAAHAERGEERFMISMREDGSVWYDILAFSRPNYPWLYAVYPLSRSLQKRFAKDSIEAMKRSIL